MDVEQVRELVDLMVANDLRELRVRNGDDVLILKRGVEPVLTSAAPAAALPAAPSPAPSAPDEAGAAAEDESLVAIRSPMVGTFYSGADPDAAPYISVGATVGPETVVCIIEAMKVFNEIKAETTGVVEKVCVQNAHAVEFGQPLFLVRPS